MPTKKGSIAGLKAHHRDKEQATQDALMKAYTHLKKTKPRALWTKTELWKQAGLKSVNALRNPKHANVVALVDRHNEDVRSVLQRGPVAIEERKTKREAIQGLRKQLKEVTEQRDKAASLNGVYEREALHYRQQYEDLLVINQRLERERDDWKRKFFETNKPKLST